MRLVWVKEINLEKKLENSEYRWLLEKISVEGTRIVEQYPSQNMWGLKKKW